jgi:hypothetical protein
MVNCCNAGISYYAAHKKYCVLVMFNFCGEFLDALSCEKGSEISIDIFHIQQMIRNDMAPEINLFKYNDLRQVFTEK